MSEAKDYGEPWHITLVSTGHRGSATTVIQDNRGFSIFNWINHEHRAVACVNACAGMAAPSAEIARLRADVERKDEALLAAYGTMISARQILRDVMYRDTPVPPGRLKTVADSCESTGRVITAALADTADTKGLNDG